MTDLNEIRIKIDNIDRQLVQLYEERMKLATEVANFKISTGKKVLDPEREAEKLKAVEKMVSDEKNIHGIHELFTQIMSMSRKMQYGLLEMNGLTLREPVEFIDEINKKGCRVVYQGVPGAYSHIAMKQFFGEDVNGFNVETWKDAMEAVKEGSADYAVLPIENSTTGMVSKIYDLLQEYNNYIIAETYVEVNHSLLGLPEADLDGIKVVYSHPQGLMQCEKFLEKHREWQQIGQPNTAGSAKKVIVENDPSFAAIASKEAAEFYGLKILCEDISDSNVNMTRFVIVTNKRVFVRDAKKVSICFETNDEAGTLYNLLSHIIYNGLNMTKIESRPIEDKPWEFRFFVEFTGNIDNLDVKNALRGIEEEANAIKLLGNY